MAEGSNNSQLHFSLRLMNSRATELKLVLEPWGEEYAFPSGAGLEVIAQGPRTGFLEFDLGDEQITIFGWPGSVISLYLDGVELGAGNQKRSLVPPTPQRPK